MNRLKKEVKNMSDKNYWAQLNEETKEDDKCWCGSNKPYKDCHKQFVLKLMELEKNHIPCPPENIIKNEEQINGIIEAGKINNKVLDMVQFNLRSGMTTEAIDKIVHDYTISLGGIPACLNYEGFPKSVCTSLNDEVCHGIPSSYVVLQDGDILNVDCTTIYKGYFADASRMFFIGDVSPNARKIVRVTKECCDLALEAIVPYQTRLGDIAEIVTKHAHRNGFTVVREIGGHGVGLEFHEDPWVGYYGNRNTGIVLVPGMVFTIEPMINEGKRNVFQDADNGWTIYTSDSKLSAQWEYTVLVTETGAKVLAN